MKLGKLLLVSILSIIVVTGCSKNSNLNEIMGVVLEFDEKSIYIEQAERWEDEEGSFSVTGSSDNKTKAILLNEETIFEVHQVTHMDGTEVVEVSKGTVEDLAQKGSVIIYGNHQNREFLANKVEIWPLSY